MDGSRGGVDSAAAWPELPWRAWRPTIATLHMWTQIVGKVRMVLAPPLNHWWHVTLSVSPRGLTTSAIPFGHRRFQVDFDFLDHRLDVVDSDGRSFTMPLAAQSVARFYREFMAGLRGMGIEVRISTKPVEVVEAIPFEADETHASYDESHANLLWRGMLEADRVLRSFQSGFAGKQSPVQFFWGGFDLAVSRYSGRPAPLHSGGAPNCPAWVMEEAYSREEASVGWWPSSERLGPAFYAYTYPEPDGYQLARVGPPPATFDEQLGEFVLSYEAVRRAADPDATAEAFFETTYEAGARLAGWDRSILEPTVRPDRPAKRPWTVAAEMAAAGRGDRPRILDHSRHSGGWPGPS
jgi:hypothetical protein